MKKNFSNYKKTIAAGGRHTVGLKSNGTVVAVGDNGCEIFFRFQTTKSER